MLDSHDRTVNSATNEYNIYSFGKMHSREKLDV